MPQIPVHSNIKKSKSFDFASHNGQIKVLSGENRNNYISVPCSAETIKWNEWNERFHCSHALQSNDIN